MHLARHTTPLDQTPPTFTPCRTLEPTPTPSGRGSMNHRSASCAFLFLFDRLSFHTLGSLSYFSQPLSPLRICHSRRSAVGLFVVVVLSCGLSMVHMGK